MSQQDEKMKLLIFDPLSQASSKSERKTALIKRSHVCSKKGSSPSSLLDLFSAVSCIFL